MSRLIFVFLVTLLLSACSNQSLDKSSSMAEVSGKGVIVASVTYAGAYSGYAVEYNKIGGGFSGVLQSGESMVFIPYFPPGDFESVGVNGNLVAVAVPEGDYEITSWFVGSGYSTVKPTKSFSIKFHVSSGKSSYIGNFDFTQLDSMGMTVTGAKLDYKSERRRDLEVYSRLYPKLALAPIEACISDDTVANDLGGAYSTKIIIPTMVMIPVGR